MKLGEYIQKLKAMDKDLELIYASDNEGNSFHKVYYTPTPGYFKDGEFRDEYEVYDEDMTEWEKVICLN